MFKLQTRLEKKRGTLIPPPPWQIMGRPTLYGGTNLRSSTKDCFWMMRGGLANSNYRGNFTRLQVIFILCLPWKARILVGLGRPRAGANGPIFDLSLHKSIAAPYFCRHWYFTPGSATWCHHSLVAFAVRRWRLSCSPQARKAAVIWTEAVVSTWLQGAYTVLVVKLWAMAADSDNLEPWNSRLRKKFFFVNCGLFTKSCTQSKIRRIFLSGMTTQPKIIKNFPREVTGLQTICVFSWNTSSKSRMSQWITQIHFEVVSYMIGYNKWRQARNVACK